MASSGRSDLNSIINDHLAALSQPGVLSIRPGYKLTGGWLTDTPAIVVTVCEKLAAPPAAELLPTEVGGVPVDVRQASTRKRQEIEDPAGYAARLRLTPDTGSVPHFADERTIAGVRPAAPASAHTQLLAVSKPEIPYSGPADASLTPVQGHVTIQLSASPDTGWPTLKTFLGDVQQSLTVGLYDFTSKHILDWVDSSLAGKKLRLVLDHPPLNPSADQSDADTVASLRSALQGNLDQAWALTKLDKLASSWIYPTSYHIKVAVRDSEAFWLSSGNWNNSNQPDITPTTAHGDPGAVIAQNSDRDWHVIIEQTELARTFEAYLLNDLQIAAEHNSPPAAAGNPITPPPAASKHTGAFKTFFPAKTITADMTITPLLTPDPGVYASAVKNLIAAATSTLYLQFQYIELPKVTDTGSQPFVDLVQAVIDRQNAGVDVRIIMSEFEVVGYLEQLQALGLDVVNKVKIQNNVHNKGIVVDCRTVLVSSQNWSTDGTLYNRDAGVIIDNPDAAEYFQQIFLHDWENLAVSQARQD